MLGWVGCLFLGLSMGVALSGLSLPWYHVGAASFLLTAGVIMVSKHEARNGR